MIHPEIHLDDVQIMNLIPVYEMPARKLGLIFRVAVKGWLTHKAE